MGMREDFAAMSAVMSQTDGERNAVLLKRMKQHRISVIESIEELAVALRDGRHSRARYLAENGIELEELERMRSACAALLRETKWIG